jgi:hypothetical protein
MCPSAGCWLEKQRSADDIDLAARETRCGVIAKCRGNWAARGNATHNGGNGPLPRKTRPEKRLQIAIYLRRGTRVKARSRPANSA